jgi:hypothetical protein
MRRSTALVVVAVLLVGVADSHVDWETVDKRGLANVNGIRVDITGWARDTVQGTLQSFGTGCGDLLKPLPGSEAGLAALAAVAQFSPPDSANPRWHQGLQAGDWLLLELSFERLSPAVVLLQRGPEGWRLHPTAIWSGSTEPWRPGPLIRDHLAQQAPLAPEALIGCFRPQQDFRTWAPRVAESSRP